MNKTDPTWILTQLENIPEGSSWVHAGIQRAKSVLKLHLNSEIDERTLKFNLGNIKKIKNEYATYHDNLLKSQLDDLLNPILDKL
jgi:hypothetical protein